MVERKVLKVVTQNFLTCSDILEDALYWRLKKLEKLHIG